jgi:hypothetical protein
MMFLGIVSPDSNYSDAELKSLATDNIQVINNYTLDKNGEMTVTVKKTVWDHEQL